MAVRITGLKEFQKKLKNLPKEIKYEVGLETLDAAKNWEQRSKRDAPVDQRALISGIVGSKIGEMTSQVTSSAEHSPYMEWGTRRRVRVPQNIASYAAKFRGPTGRTGAKKAIYAWMDRVGIPKEAQWAVFVSIMTNGVNPQPFFFIQRPHVEREFIKSVNNILNTPR